MLALSDLRLDGGTQPRAYIDSETVDAYAESILAGAKFPPPVVFYDGASHWLADGFHRVHAHMKLATHAIDCDVRQGTQRDAVLYSLGANATHGKPRTNADKRRAVEVLLRDEEWSRRSNEWIAEKCAVSPPFVGKMRADAAPTQNVLSERAGRDGRVTNTANIGKPAKPAPVAARSQQTFTDAVRTVAEKHRETVRELAEVEVEEAEGPEVAPVAAPSRLAAIKREWAALSRLDRAAFLVWANGEVT